MNQVMPNIDAMSEEAYFEPISTQAVIHDKKKLSEGFTYTLRYTDRDLADQVGYSSITSEGLELHVNTVVDVYAAVQTIKGKIIVSVHQVVGLVNDNQQIIFDGSRDDPNFEDTTTTIQASIALVGVEARLNMYDDCGVNPMDM